MRDGGNTPENKKCMKYIDIYKLLKNSINYTESQITIPEVIEIRNYDFTSNNCHILPDNTVDNTLNGYDTRCETGIMHEMLDIHDCDLKDNISFRYHVFSPIGTEKAKEIVLMLYNAAISTRIHTNPQRFFWSGLQTYYDVIQFIENYKSGFHPFITPDAGIDVFAYSIGVFLSEVLFITNHNNYFDKSKLVMFCGGPVFNRMSPVSKSILDSQANVVIYSYIIEHLDSHLKKDEKLRHYLCERPEGISFRSMLNYGLMSDFREERLRSMAERLLAVALRQDTIVPAYEIVNTLQGKYRDIPVRVDIHDLPYPYKHEDPFPTLEKISEEIDAEFRRIFDSIGKFLFDS